MSDSHDNDTVIKPVLVTGLVLHLRIFVVTILQQCAVGVSSFSEAFDTQTEEPLLFDVNMT